MNKMVEKDNPPIKQGNPKDGSSIKAGEVTTLKIKMPGLNKVKDELKEYIDTTILVDIDTRIIDLVKYKSLTTLGKDIYDDIKNIG